MSGRRKMEREQGNKWEGEEKDEERKCRNEVKI